MGVDYLPTLNPAGPLVEDGQVIRRSKTGVLAIMSTRSRVAQLDVNVGDQRPSLNISRSGTRHNREYSSRLILHDYFSVPVTKARPYVETDAASFFISIKPPSLSTTLSPRKGIFMQPIQSPHSFPIRI